MRYFRARHVATMTTAGVIEDGCLVIDDEGVIAAVGRTSDLQPPRIDFDIDGLLTPGLINAHTHLELTNVPRPPTPGTFQNWLRTTMAATWEADQETLVRKRAEAAEQGVAQCLKFGVTTIGDISQNVDVVRPILAPGPLRSISFGECLGVGPRRHRFNDLLNRAADGRFDSLFLEAGISPHAPYTVAIADYLRVDRSRFPFHRTTTHLLETPDEDEFVVARTGPFFDMYERLGFDPGPVETIDKAFDGTQALCEGLHGWLLAHVNYCDDKAMAAIRRVGSAVVWCPRTHAYFGHPPHRWRDMRAAGIPVCVGTDSCASSPNLNLMDDLRLVRRQCPDEPAETLWQLATSSAADALQWHRTFHPPEEIGRLRARALADLVWWPTQTNAPLAEVLETAGLLPNGVWIGGGCASGL